MLPFLSLLNNKSGNQVHLHNYAVQCCMILENRPFISNYINALGKKIMQPNLPTIDSIELLNNNNNKDTTEI